MGNGRAGRRIEVCYATGMRMLAVPAGVSTLDAAMLAQEIWDDEQGRIDVRLMLRDEQGESACICHLPPE